MILLFDLRYSIYNFFDLFAFYDVDGLSFDDIASAMRVGITAICRLGDDSGVKRISAGNYGGKLGPHHFKLHEIMQVNNA